MGVHGSLRLLLADLSRDVRHAFRMLAATPTFTLIMVLTLALGIGANTAIVSAVDAILLRAIPIADPTRVVTIHTASADGRNAFDRSGFAHGEYTDLRDAGVFEGLSVVTNIAAALDMDGATEQIAGHIVSWNYFDVLGVRFATGRGFREEEDRPGAPVRVVVLSHAFWTRRLASDRNAVGRSITLNGQSFAIVGVTAAGFRSHALEHAPELFVPLALQPEMRLPSAGLRRQLGTSNLLNSRVAGWLDVFGRLRAGETATHATSALNTIGNRPEWRHPASGQPTRFIVATLGDAPGLRRSSRPMLALLSGVTIAVLLIACTNVAGLLAARAVSRRREVAIRMAVGAGRARLIRQWLTESVLLALIGCAGALLVAHWMTTLFYRFGVPETIDLSISGRVLAFTVFIGVVCGLLFGLAPVLQAVRRSTLGALRDEGGAIASGVQGTRMRGAFVVVQVALSLVLLVAAGLFLRTVRNAYAVDPGYQVDGVLIADVNLDLRGYTPAAGQDVYHRLFARLATLPGVRAVGASRVALLTGGSRTGAVSLDGQPVRPDRSNAMRVRINVISDGYLGTLGIPILRGRGFGPSDTAGSPQVAIVSQALATRAWPGQDPIGRPLHPTPDSPTVIGVVPDAVYTSVIELNPPPFFLLPLSQNYESGMSVHVRSAGDPVALFPAVRQVLREIDPQLVFARSRTLSGELESSLGVQRLLATFVGLFAALALFLAAIGLYGMMAHAASHRRAEIGIRLALGARPAAILSMILVDGLRLVVIGAALGLAGAIAASRFVERQLFGVGPMDPTTYGAVVLLLAAVASAACLIPAVRAMRVDPVLALRR
jgi:predicted permease